VLRCSPQRATPRCPTTHISSRMTASAVSCTDSTPSREVDVDEHGHRHLAYSSLCSKKNTYVTALHMMTFRNNRGNNKTTYVCNGAYFLKDGGWK
jgi:hypothetical protein